MAPIEAKKLNAAGCESNKNQGSSVNFRAKKGVKVYIFDFRQSVDTPEAPKMLTYTHNFDTPVL